MSKIKKVREKILLGNSDANIGFNDLRKLLNFMGFEERVKGDHHIFAQDGIEEIINRHYLK